MGTKVDIISGFLGAGKTTLIRKLLEQKLSGERIAIVENEFGEVGIDGNILKNKGIEIKEINSGCICCTLAGDFGKALKEVIAQYSPDRIIIEPSGVAKLSDVLKACNAAELKELVVLNMVITVVDVLKYQMYVLNFGEFFENQIKSAKTIILSRTQKADSKRIETVTNDIRKLNPNSNIITTPWDTMNANLMISVAEQDASISLQKQMSEAKKITLKIPGHRKDCKCSSCDSPSYKHNADEVFEVWGHETPKLYEKADLDTILNALENQDSFGMIVRAKGILPSAGDQWLQFDYVPKEYEIKSTSADYTGRLCVIGKDLNRKGLGELFGILA